MATRKDLYNNLIEKSFENLNMIQDLTEKTKIMVELSKAVALGSILEVDHDENIGIVNKEESIIKEDKSEEINNEKEETEETKEPEVEVVQESEKAQESQEEEVQEVQQEKAQETQQEEVQPEEIQEENNEPTIEAKTIDPSVNIWTEETIKEYYNEISELKNYTKKLGEGEITKQVSEFSQGVLTNGLQDIGPANIESFLLYLKNILKA